MAQSCTTVSNSPLQPRQRITNTGTYHAAFVAEECLAQILSDHFVYDHVQIGKDLLSGNQRGARQTAEEFEGLHE